MQVDEANGQKKGANIAFVFLWTASIPSLPTLKTHTQNYEKQRKRVYQTQKAIFRFDLSHYQKSTRWR